MQVAIVRVGKNCSLADMHTKGTSKNCNGYRFMVTPALNFSDIFVP